VAEGLVMLTHLLAFLFGALACALLIRMWDSE
jgi:hypothetical protein